MKYTYTKQYPATDNSLRKDTNWAFDHFGPSGNISLRGRWATDVSFAQGSWIVTYSFIDKDDFTLFVVSCG